MDRRNAWKTWREQTRNEALSFAEGYRYFLTNNKVERKFVQGSLTLAEEHGYQPIKSYHRLKPGDRVYAVNRNKQIVFCQIGEKPLSSGGQLIAAHIDSPRLDLKTDPVYEESGLTLLKTYYYGGIKKYHWLNIPLALYGTVILKNGEKKEICVGEDPGDPVFTITDLLPHLAKDQMKKTIEEGFPGENLNILAGSFPRKGGKKESVKSHFLHLLREKWGIEEEDLISSEFRAVPAGPARDLGLDRSMILGYGQDDRVCAYTGLQALLNISSAVKSCFCLLVDQEEIGSYGATSAQSSFFQGFVEELFEKTGMEAKNQRVFYENSKAISADVAAAFDPTYREAFDLRNAAQIGSGVVLERTTGAKGKAGSTEPTAEYLSYLRNIFDRNRICWQTGELGKVEQGGGGTVATFFARLNIDTADCGVPVLSMHSPFEVTSKADIYSAYQAYSAFYLG
ncbi:MAG: aminopeptidase [Candidatus Omnitrophica bacterium]|nr:aminopeptidase [Candidatus Omnitrophota bacterium]